MIRGKAKITNVLTLKHSYKYYIKDIDKESRYYIKEKLYKDICEEFNKLLLFKIIEEGFIFTIPYRLGALSIKKRKTLINNLKHDYNIYNTKGLKNEHLNDHSGGYYCRFYWNKQNAIIVNKSNYSFIPTRTNKRYLASYIKENGKYSVNKYME
jgi:hypothetical protein